MTELNLKELQKRLVDVSANIFNHPPKCELTNDETLEYGSVVANIEEQEQKGVGGTFTRPVIVVSIVTYYGGTYWEPPEWDYDEQGVCFNYWAAVDLMIGLEVSLMVNNAAESEVEETPTFFEDMEGGLQ